MNTAEWFARVESALPEGYTIARKEDIERMRATLLNIQAMAERGDPIDCGKLATRCRHALNQQNRNTDAQG